MSDVDMTTTPNDEDRRTGEVTYTSNILTSQTTETSGEEEKQAYDLPPLQEDYNETQSLVSTQTDGLMRLVITKSLGPFLRP